ncbi:hypothetical protein [Pedobacter africanus]|uniref:Uncharacterized protein n=1 Tax=Pedobacter africanus TaxID=151894 RepID=A0ACC6L1N1_9SPHI|nr:hypothetical protein [Pedobacter africanus]MDR6785325.1 hypothetical protein [Pedobacter africanus]
MGQAAQVTVTVNIQPPYSPYYSDYSGANAGKVLLILRNLTTTPKNVKLKGQLTGSNGISVSTKSTYTPLQPIVLQPNETKQLNGTALKDIFDLNSLNVYGVNKVKLVQTSRLPEGNYDFCIQAVDMNSNQTISDAGCTKFDISYPNAPILISPMAFEKVNAVSPQSVSFNWINAGTVPMNTQYIIQLMQMPDVPADPNQVLNAATFPMLNQRVIGTSYRYGTANIPLKVGKKYAWRVIASDPSGKTGFMNDGKSQASVFVYGSSDQLAIVDRPNIIPDLLNIISPVCKNGTGKVTVGPNTRLYFNWLWKDQIESIRLFGNLDSNLLKHYTRVKVNAAAKPKGGADNFGYENIKSYNLSIYRQKGSLGKSVISLKIDAPVQALNLNKQEAQQLGLVTGQSYKFILTASNENGKQISRTESCDWLLVDEAPMTTPKLTVKGKLNYTFDELKYYGANKASISLQVVKNVDEGLDKNRVVLANGKSVPQPVAYATTDAEGNFTAQIDQLPADTGLKYLAIAINSGYYQNRVKNKLINVPKIIIGSDGNSVKQTQDILDVKDINTNVFHQTVTVKLFKEFGGDYTGTFKDENGKNVSQNYTVDKGLINSQSKVGAGVLVGIYRKVKSEFVPKYEGDIGLKNPLFKVPKDYILVAEAKSFIKEGQAQVVFDRLLFRYADLDEYYIRAVAPAEEDLAAPEQWLGTSMGMSAAVKVKYTNSVNYTMVSKKPPTARIKGKIMQQWPSAPGVLYPYANKPFTVKMTNKNSFASQVIANDNCQVYPSAVQQKITGPDGQTRYVNIPGTGSNFDKIVATGVTDKDGNYDLSIFDFVEMKDYNVELVATSNVPVGPTCAEIAAEKAAKEAAAQAAMIEKLKEQSKTGTMLTDKGSSKMLERQIADLGKATGRGVLTGESAGADNKGGGLEVIVIGAGAADLTAKYGVGGSGGNPFQSGGSPINPVNLQIQQLSAPAKMGKVNVGGLGNISGPFAIVEEDDNSLSTGPMAETGVLTRYFAFEGIVPVSTINNDAGNTIDHFVVQPFGSVNLGVSVINIDEIKEHKVEVSAKVATVVKNSNSKWYDVVNAPDNSGLNGAKLVLFRPEKKRPAAGTYPPGEGSSIHPIKKLINTGYNDNTPKYFSKAENGGGTWKSAQAQASGYDGEVEWVLEESVGIVMGSGNTGTFNLSNKRLWKKGEYWAIITPGPDGNGGRFDPIITKLFSDGTSTKIDVRLSPSRISGRVIDNNSSVAIPAAPVNLVVYDKNSKQEKIISKSPKTIITNENGYFEITNASIDGFSWTDGDRFSVSASPKGYSNPDAGKLSDITKVNALRILKANGQNYDVIIKKTYGATIKGQVMGETGSGSLPVAIDAYVIREDDYLIVSKQPAGKAAVENYVAGLAVAAGKTQKLKIIPVDPAFIPVEVLVEPITEGSTFVKNFILKRRKHRMLFDITTTDGQKVPNADIRITINNDVNNTDGTVLSKLSLDSKVKFEFENVSVNNYTIQIADEKGNGYIPKIFSISNEEGDKEFTYPVTVEKGAKISGKVTLNGIAAKNARVYVDYSASEASPSAGLVKTDLAALEDYTDENGFYEIKGLPMANNEYVTLHVTMASNVTVNGAARPVQIINKAANADFALNTFDGPLINQVYGFPLSVEKIKKLPDNKVLVTGIVDLSKNNSAFGWLNPDTKLRISDIVFDGGNNYQPTDIVPLDALKELKMKYRDQYNVLLERTSGAVLGIQSTSKGGAVVARVSIADNSFNFPASYLNFTQTDPAKEGYNKPIQFYLSEPGNSSREPNKTKISAIYSGPKETAEYYLSDKTGGSLSFSFIGFKTTANAKKSYIGEDGKIHLDINFKGTVPKSTPGTVDIDINDLVLDGNKIYPAKKTDPLIVNLQTWKLEVRDWELNPEKGGIYSTNSLIKTGLVDIPVGTFNLRSDMCVIKDFDLSKLSLGGGLLPLTGISKTKTNFNLVFDEACGSDQGPHWRFSATPVGADPVATIAIPVVPNKFPGTNLKVNYFQLISYNKEDIISLSGAEKGIPLYDNPKFTFFPASVTSNVGSYSLAGQAAFNLPRVNNAALDLLFEKSGSSMTMRTQSFKMGFEGRGYVQFANDQKEPSIDPNVKGLTSIRGTVVEPGKLNPIPCTLKFGLGNEGRIILDKGVLNLDGEGEPGTTNLTLKISDDLEKNGMKVQNKDWTTLKFSGELNDPQSTALVTKKPIYDFEVLGEIQANSKGISVEQISTPLGDVQMLYDFKSRRMTGSLRMNGVPFGSYKFSGDVEVGYGGSQGFLVLGAGQLNTGTFPVDGFGTFNVGVLFANANLNEGNIAKVTQYSRAKENICWLQDNRDNFKGFFLTGGYDIINERKGIDVGVAAIYFNAVVGVEASIGANFNKPDFRALVSAHADVSAGMSAITGTSISGSMKARITASGGYDPKGFSIAGSAGMTLGYKIKQSLLVETLTFDGSVDAGVRFRYQPKNTSINFFLGKDTGMSECPLPK